MADLFDNPKSATRPAKPPGWVISELVTKWGCNPASVKAWSSSKAFAVLFSYRDRKTDPREARRKRVTELADRLTKAAGSEDGTAAELSDLIAEACAALVSTELAEVARACAILLVPPATAPKTGRA